MTQSRSEIFNRTAADIVCVVLICAAIPIAVIAIALVRLAEAACDSSAGKAVYRFWFGRRAP